ncbi:TPA: HNH endonuclease, partial [Mannheimia haemolytica]
AENPAVKVSVSVGTQKQERESRTTSVTHSKSNLNGGNVALISEKGKVALEGVDTRVKDTLLLDGKLGIESKGVADTYQNNTKNKNHSASVGVFIGLDRDSFGIGFEAGVSGGKGKENIETETWQNNQLQAGKIVTNSANGKLMLDATNVKANHWEGEVQDFEARSRQDISKYKSEYTEGSVHGTLAVGTTGVNGHVAYNGAKLNTAQVENQTAIDIGKGGMDVKVKKNAHFDGAVMTSQAEKENNRFQAGTLTTGDIENHSELKTRSAAISGGTSGVNPMSALSLLGNKNESERSTTKAAIGENIAITLTEDPNAETTLNQLNRDTQNANQKVTKHDISEVKETQELVKGIGEIAEKAYQIYTHSEREKVTEAKLALGKAQAQKASKEEIGKLEANLDRLQKEFDKNYGTGSKTKRALDVVAGALQGLAAKDVGQAAVGLASPYLNAEIKKYTEGDPQANLIAHALLGAVEAAATGNNVLAGAAAGAGSEAAADFIVKTLYKGKSTQDLTEAEKQNVTLLSQLASGLASGLIGDSTQSAAVGADIGKRAVENNYLSHSDVYAYQKALKKAIENGESVEEVHKHFKALSEKQRDELLADCDIDCRMTVPQTLLGAVNLADDLSGALNSWLQGLPFEEQGKFYQLVESENQKTIEALKEKQTGLEKGIELAMDASRLLAKEVDINTPKTKQSLYDSKKTREKLEKEFGKENVVSTTIAASGIRNTNLAGKKHPKTGVPFDSKGYPIFDDIAKYDTRLDIKSFRSATYPEQMEMATKQLYKDLGEDGLKKLFNQKQINAIKNGDKKIPGFTWHHHQDTGRMQLVPEWQHSKTGHIGGDYIQKGK